jgi:hypothetical protein
MIRRRVCAVGLALLVSAALPSRSHADTVFNFNYLIPATPDEQAQGYVSISAMGTLTATLDPGSGDYVVTDITGTRTVGGVLTNITGLLPPNAYFNSNVLYPAPPLLDFYGISFAVDNAALSDDGAGDVNIYFDAISRLYAEPYFAVAEEGTFNASMAASTAETPEPSTTLLIGLLAGASFLFRKRRQSRVSPQVVRGYKL